MFSDWASHTRCVEEGEGAIGVFEKCILFLIFIYYVYNILSVCMPLGQKRAPDHITDGCEPPCDCWELNSGPLEEQAMLLTISPAPKKMYSLLLFLLSMFISLNVSAKGIGSHGTEVTVDSEAPCEWWELIQDLLQQQ